MIVFSLTHFTKVLYASAYKFITLHSRDWSDNFVKPVVAFLKVLFLLELISVVFLSFFFLFFIKSSVDFWIFEHYRVFAFLIKAGRNIPLFYSTDSYIKLTFLKIFFWNDIRVRIRDGPKCHYLAWQGFCYTFIL